MSKTEWETGDPMLNAPVATMLPEFGTCRWRVRRWPRGSVARIESAFRLQDAEKLRLDAEKLDEWMWCCDAQIDSKGQLSIANWHTDVNQGPGESYEFFVGIIGLAQFHLFLRSREGSGRKPVPSEHESTGEDDNR